MSYISRLVHHERLMTRLAARNGADLDLAMMSGALSPADVRSATQACLGCTDPERCAAHLDDASVGMPAFCRNAEMIARVADMTLPVSD